MAEKILSESGKDLKHLQIEEPVIIGPWYMRPEYDQMPIAQELRGQYEANMQLKANEGVFENKDIPSLDKSSK